MRKPRATREAYGETLVELYEEGCDVVAVEADLSGSTTTTKLGAVDPDRLVNVGIAEQNMVDVAAGMSLTGKIAFTGSFAVFGTGRVYDQIRNTVCEANLNVKIAPTHAGITVGPDGGSHQMIEDINLMRGLPNMRVLVPADYCATKAAIRLAAKTSGPFYIRMGRAAVPQIYDDGFELELGKAYVLKEGTDATLFAAGIEVAEALKAAEILARNNISVEVIDVPSIKPLDTETVVASASKTGLAITIEEHSIIGGLGSAVSECLSEHHPTQVVRIGVNDVFGLSGEPAELIEYFGLDGVSIAKKVEEAIKAKM